MISSLSAELFKIRTRPAVLTTAAVWLLLSCVFGYVFPYFSYRSLDDSVPAQDRDATVQALAEALPDSLGTTSIGGLPIFAGALAILLGVLVTGSEYVWRTQKLVVTQGPSRTAVQTAKTLAVCLLFLGILAASFVLNAGAGQAVARATGRSGAWPGADDLVLALGAGLLIAAVWGTLGMLLATVLRGTALPIGLGLVWVLAIENLLRTGVEIPVIGTLQQYTPGSAAGSLVGALGPTATPGVNTTLSAPVASGVLVTYVVLFALATVVVGTRRDVE